MWTAKPPNPFATTLMIACGVAVTAIFLSVCFPASALAVWQSLSGAHLGILLAFIVGGLVVVHVMSNVANAIVELLLKLLQIGGVLAVVGLLWFAFLNRDRLPVTPTQLAAQADPQQPQQTGQVDDPVPDANQGAATGLFPNIAGPSTPSNSDIVKPKPVVAPEPLPETQRPMPKGRWWQNNPYEGQ